MKMSPEGPAMLRHDRVLIRSAHLSPLGANRKTVSLSPFIGSRPFSRTNQALVRMGEEHVDWEIKGAEAHDPTTPENRGTRELKNQRTEELNHKRFASLHERNAEWQKHKRK